VDETSADHDHFDADTDLLTLLEIVQASDGSLASVVSESLNVVNAMLPDTVAPATMEGLAEARTNNGLLNVLRERLAKVAKYRADRPTTVSIWKDRVHRAMGAGTLIAREAMLRLGGQPAMNEDQRCAVHFLHRASVLIACEHWCGHHWLCGMGCSNCKGKQCTQQQHTYSPLTPAEYGGKFIASFRKHAFLPQLKLIQLAASTNSSSVEQLNLQIRQYAPKTLKTETAWPMLVKLGLLDQLNPAFRKEAA